MNINRRIGLAIAFCGMLLMCFGLAKSANMLAISNILSNGGFESGTVDPWIITTSGAGNTGALTVTADSHFGSYAGLLSCTNWNTPGGSVSARYWLSSSQISPSQTYSISFYYKSTCHFYMWVFTTDSNWVSVGGGSIYCDATSAWTYKTATVEFSQQPTYTWIEVALYQVGSVTFDNVEFGYETSDPIATPTPSPEPTDDPFGDTWAVYPAVDSASPATLDKTDVLYRLGTTETFTVTCTGFDDDWTFSHWEFKERKGAIETPTFKYYTETVSVGPKAAGTYWDLVAVYKAVEPQPTPTPIDDETETNWLLPETVMGGLMSLGGLYLYGRKR